MPVKLLWPLNAARGCLHSPHVRPIRTRECWRTCAPSPDPSSTSSLRICAPYAVLQGPVSGLPRLWPAAGFSLGEEGERGPEAPCFLPLRRRAAVAWPARAEAVAPAGLRSPRPP